MPIMVASSSSSSSTTPRDFSLKRSSSVREISSNLHRRFLRSLSNPMATSNASSCNLPTSPVNDPSNPLGPTNNNGNGNLGLGLNFISTLNTSKSKSNRGRQLEPSVFRRSASPSPLASDNKVISSCQSSPSTTPGPRLRAKSNASICSTPTTPGLGIGLTCNVTSLSMSSPNINAHSPCTPPRPQTPSLTVRSSLSTGSVVFTPKTASPEPSEAPGGYFECKHHGSNTSTNSIHTPVGSYQDDLPPPPTSNNNDNDNNNNNNNNSTFGGSLTSVNLSQVTDKLTPTGSSTLDDSSSSMPSLAKIASNDEDAAADEMAMHILAMVKSNDKSWIKSDVFEDGLLTL